MLRLFRIFAGILIASVAMTGRSSESQVGGGATANPSSASGALPRDFQAELDALRKPAWIPSGSVRASAGWRDNVLLSPFAPVERSFGRGEIEAMLLRPMRDRWEFISFLNGDVVRFFSPPPESGGEQQWSLYAEIRWQPVNPARL